MAIRYPSFVQLSVKPPVRVKVLSIPELKQDSRDCKIFADDVTDENIMQLAIKTFSLSITFRTEITKASFIHLSSHITYICRLEHHVRVIYQIAVTKKTLALLRDVPLF